MGSYDHTVLVRGLDACGAREILLGYGVYLTILTGFNARERYLIYILTGEHRMSDVSLSNDMTANSTASKCK